MTGRISRGRGPGAVLRGVTAIATLAVLVVGLPLALYKLGGDPMPGHIPSGHRVTTLLMHRDNGSVFLGAVRDVSWMAWALFTAAVVTETQATVRGRRAPRLRLGGMQNAASWLVAIAALAFTGQPAAVLASAPTSVAVVSAARPSPPPGIELTANLQASQLTADPHAPQVMSMGFSQMVTVRSGECLWTMAQRYLGDGDRYPEIVKLNLGHEMGDGHRFTDPSVIWPGWVLQVPTIHTASAPGAPAHGTTRHGGHLSSDPRFGSPHPAAGASAPAVDTAGVPTAGAVPSASAPAQPTVPPARSAPAAPSVPAPSGHQAPAAAPPPAHRPLSARPAAAEAAELNRIPSVAVFGAGVLVGGASVALARMRRRQRQARRFGRRIPLPASAPVIAAEQRLRAANRTYAMAPEWEQLSRPATADPASSPDRARDPAPLRYETGPEPGTGLYDGPNGDSGTGLYDGANGANGDSATALYDGAASQLGEPWYPDRASEPLLYDGAAQEYGSGLYDGAAAEPQSPPYPGAGPDPGPEPATALRAALSQVGAGLVAGGQPIPGIAGVWVHRSGLELLLDSPSSEPPPPPFVVPGGRQGKAWKLALPPPAPLRLGGAGDLLPGLVTAGIAGDGGYVLIDLEYLRVTTVDGPADLADLVLASAAAELTTSQLAGWYDLILAGFPELDPVDGRATSCASLAEALDLLASKAVALRRRLGDADRSDVRRRRIEEPGDEDWALTLLVSRTAPTSEQLAMLLDLAAEPGGIAALVVGGADAPEGHPAPASFRLGPDLSRPDGIAGHLAPLHLDVWPQPLTRNDYQALASLFATAAEPGDVSADQPPYDGSSWPPAPGLVGLEEPPGPHPADLEDLTAAPPEPTDAADAADAAGQAGDGQPADQPATGRHAKQAPADRPDPEPPGPDDPTQAPSLRIGVLGTFTVNGAPAALQPAQSQLVLALALNGRDGLSNAQLCYLLGADPDHPKPTDSLRQLIVRTRRQLGRTADGREWIEHLGAGQYALHPGATFDWAEFEELSQRGLAERDVHSLRKALMLIRGKPFTGCYHWWLDLAFTETVRAQIVDAAGLLAELELSAGDPSAAARAARTGLAGDVAAEQLWRALMRAEHGAGNLAGVREAWSRCLDTMTDIAADGEPHPDTAALYQELIGGDRPQPAWVREARGYR
jgi:DNA-binding SARP family transcriptional activator